MRHHRFDDIGHHQNLARGEEVAAEQAARVARAVAPLVVLVDDLRDLTVEARGLDDQESRLRVQLDQLELDLETARRAC